MEAPVSDITRLMSYYIHALLKSPRANGTENVTHRDHLRWEDRGKMYDQRYPLPGGAFLVINYDISHGRHSIKPNLLSTLLGPSRRIDVYYCIGDISSRHNPESSQCFDDYTPIDILGYTHLDNCYESNNYWDQGHDCLPSPYYIDFFLHALVGDYDDPEESEWGQTHHTVGTHDWTWGEIFTNATQNCDFDYIAPINKKRILDHFRILSKLNSKTKQQHDVMQMHLPHRSPQVQEHLQNVRRGGRSWEVVIRDFKKLLNLENITMHNGEFQGVATLSKDGLEMLARQMPGQRV